MMINNKKGVSEMVAYVLLIVIAISISIIVYSYLNAGTIKVPPKCPEGTSLMIADYSCAEDKLSLTIKNSGLHGVDGFIIHISNDTKKARFALGAAGGEVYFAPRLNNSFSKTISFDYSKHGQVNRTEIKPFRFETNRIICEDAIITQEITGCG